MYTISSYIKTLCIMTHSYVPYHHVKYPYYSEQS